MCGGGEEVRSEGDMGYELCVVFNVGFFSSSYHMAVAVAVIGGTLRAIVL